MESPENSSLQETESSHEETTTTTTTKTRTKNHPRRFSGEQIKSLESIFKLDTKLDPTKKLQIASDLGLHPRQVAIWFQNKRARWRSKQIEHEYKLLRSDYNTLSLQFEDLKREKLSLQMQLQELSDADKNLDNVKFGEVKEEHPNSSSEGMDHNDEKIINSYFEKAEDQEFVCWDEEADINQTWRNLSSSSGLFDRSTGDSNWWES